MDEIRYPAIELSDESNTKPKIKHKIEALNSFPPTHNMTPSPTPTDKLKHELIELIKKQLEVIELIVNLN